jgi:uncharacterized DUF497 family protein
MTINKGVPAVPASSRNLDYHAALDDLRALDRSAYEIPSLMDMSDAERRTQLYEFVQGRVRMNWVAEMDLRIFALRELLNVRFRVPSGLGHPSDDGNALSWDPVKNGQNIFKHGLSFDEITHSHTFGTLSFPVDDEADGNRQIMFSTLDVGARAQLAMPLPGFDGEVYLLTVATLRGETLRFISSRRVSNPAKIRKALKSDVKKLNLAPLERDLFLNHCASRIEEWLAPRLATTSDSGSTAG